MEKIKHSGWIIVTEQTKWFGSVHGVERDSFRVKEVKGGKLKREHTFVALVPVCCLHLQLIGIQLAVSPYTGTLKTGPYN